MQEKKRNIIFIGGIHGVGKGTICKRISNNKNIAHVSASEVIKWKEINSNNDKRVDDFDRTQSMLLKGIERLKQDSSTLILDGHYCLLNSNNEPEKISEKTFEEIAPKVMAIVIEDEEIIYERLKQRDGTKYSLSLLKKMQKMEIDHAKHLSSKYEKPYVEIFKSDFSLLKKYLQK